MKPQRSCRWPEKSLMQPSGTCIAHPRIAADCIRLQPNPACRQDDILAPICMASSSSVPIQPQVEYVLSVLLLWARGATRPCLGSSSGSRSQSVHDPDCGFTLPKYRKGHPSCFMEIDVDLD